VAIVMHDLTTFEPVPDYLLGTACNCACAREATQFGRPTTMGGMKSWYLSGIIYSWSLQKNGAHSVKVG